MASERASRYSGIFDVEKASRTVAVVVGCGAVGRNVALQLASLGVGAMVLIDFDEVSEANLGPQGWRPGQIGEQKVEALAEDCDDINPEMAITPIDDKFGNEDMEDAIQNLISDIEGKSKSSASLIVFCCVDCMDARKEVAEWVATNETLCPGPMAMIEARMGPEQCMVQTMTPAQIGAWIATWFPAHEAAPMGCTEKATTYCAAITAGLMLNTWTRLIRELPVPLTLEVNLLGQYMLAENAEAPAESEETAETT